ncbi:MAG TPA: 30S ribosomal protein S20 [Patescibacteria group bacterium]|nr:30S ribosomal protein S20 [Patescibacteria group bacterium]
MPVTVTAKRALRSSKRKAKVNRNISTSLEVAIRMAKKSKKPSQIVKAISLTDRATKKKYIHKNKAARIKSSLSKLLPKTAGKNSKKVKK